MVVLVVREGLLFGADRNVTTTNTLTGSTSQAPRRKVLKWPNREIVVGYVGRAEVAGRPADDWLEDFIGRDTGLSLRRLAENLKRDLESDLGSQVGAQGMILHLCGFVEDAGQWKPQVWYVRNTTIDSNYQDVKAEFDVSEEIDSRGKFPGWTGNQIRTRVDQMAHAWNPFWFRQGIDLITFHMLDATIRQGMHAIVEEHPDRLHPFPDSLEEWSKHLKMTILTYGSYFGAFHLPSQRFVGGGLDVVSVEWP
jgi:hypothetical protein